MGYDLYVQGIPQAEEDECWSPKYYLRRSIGSIEELRRALVLVGAVFENYDYQSGWFGVPSHPGGSQPEFPGKEHFEAIPVEGWTDQDGNPIYDAGDPVTDEGRAYREAAEAWLRWRPERAGIPIHKLCDNSGWHVTKDECEEALGAIHVWVQEGNPLPEAFYDDLVPFLESAAAHDGFRVH